MAKGNRPDRSGPLRSFNSVERGWVFPEHYCVFKPQSQRGRHQPFNALEPPDGTASIRRQGAATSARDAHGGWLYEHSRSAGEFGPSSQPFDGRECIDSAPSESSRELGLVGEPSEARREVRLVCAVEDREAHRAGGATKQDGPFAARFVGAFVDERVRQAGLVRDEC